MKVRRLKHDILFSNLVRERAAWCCESCGRYFPEDQRGGLHCSHFFSRRNRSTRFDPQNCAAHCFTCHQRFGENPIEFTEWIEAHIGKAAASKLRLRANTPQKFSKGDLKDLYDDMKAQLAWMQSERNRGVTGRLEFEL